MVEYPSLKVQSGNSVTCLACLEERFTESGEMSIIATCWDQSTYLITPEQVLDLEIRVCNHCCAHPQDRFFGRIVRMALSPNQDYLAFCTSEGWISVVTTDFRTKVLLFPPSQLDLRLQRAQPSRPAELLLVRRRQHRGLLEEPRRVDAESVLRLSSL